MFIFDGQFNNIASKKYSTLLKPLVIDGHNSSEINEGMM